MSVSLSQYNVLDRTPNISARLRFSQRRVPSGSRHEFPCVEGIVGSPVEYHPTGRLVGASSRHNDTQKLVTPPASVDFVFRVSAEPVVVSHSESFNRKSKERESIWNRLDRYGNTGRHSKQDLDAVRRDDSGFYFWERVHGRNICYSSGPERLWSKPVCASFPGHLPCQ